MNPYLCQCSGNCVATKHSIACPRYRQWQTDSVRCICPSDTPPGDHVPECAYSRQNFPSLYGDQPPLEPNAPETVARDYTVPVCPVLWDVAVALNDRTEHTLVLARWPLEALAECGRFYSWPEPEGHEVIDESGVSYEGNLRYRGHLLAGVFPFRECINVTVREVRALDTFVVRTLTKGTGSVRQNP